MIDPSDLVRLLFTVSGTLAALCVPASSLIFYIITNTDNEDDRKRYGSIATLCALSGILFMFSAVLSLISLVYDFCNSTSLIVMLGFILGCIMIVLIFLSFTGVTLSIKKKFPSLRKEKGKTSSSETITPSTS